MSIIDALRVKIAANPEAKVIHLSARPYYALLAALDPYVVILSIAYKLQFEGLDVVRVPPRWTCRNCGAPIEPDVCSYCKTQTELIEVL